MNDDELAYPANGERSADLTNMSLALKTLLDVQDAGERSPRLAIFYGPSGYGKTVAAAFAAAHTGAAYIQARSIWTTRSLLEAIAEEIGIPNVARTSPKILAQIVQQLTIDDRPLIIDEMDYLVKRQAVEIIRDIHESTSIGIMMIGEEGLPQKLKEWERFHNRILVATAAQPASDDDALKLRDLYCTHARVSDELALHFRARCNGVTRRIVVNLKAAQRAAIDNGLDAIDLETWGGRAVMTGDVPARRRAA